MENFKAVIIGSGQAGNPLAVRLAEAGWKTAIVERRKVGGTCVNDGCTPTKSMIASAKVADVVRKSREWGVIADNPIVKMVEIIRRKDEIVSSFREGSIKSFEETENLKLIYGEASFSDAKTITVSSDSGNQELTADFIFINTGTRPEIPGIPGLKEAGYLTSTTILDLKKIPVHLLILGGGPVALEFAQMYKRFGSKVTLVEQNETILSFEDDDVAKEVTKILSEDDISIITKGEAVKFSRFDDQITVEISSNSQTESITCSHMLVAAGRIPNTDGLNLNLAGIKTDKRGYIEVNEKLETSAEKIYALGDVKGGPAFTHVAYNDHLVVAENLLNNGNKSISNRLVPYCIFTDPQLGRVGLSEKEAREKGIEIKVAKLPMEHVARAIETGETRGFMKVIVEKESGKILGASILGSEGGEIMGVLQMAMMGEITYDKIRDGVFAHPTYTESLNNLFMSLD